MFLSFFEYTILIKSENKKVVLIHLFSYYNFI